jgi:hypothetical protein
MKILTVLKIRAVGFLYTPNRKIALAIFHICCTRFQPVAAFQDYVQCLGVGPNFASLTDEKLVVSPRLEIFFLTSRMKSF